MLGDTQVPRKTSFKNPETAHQPMWWIPLTAILFNLCASANAQESGSTGDPALRTLGGITFREPFGPVLARLGTPIEIVEDGYAAWGNQYIYEGLVMWAGIGEYYRVLQIQVTSPKYCTTSGVCPGTSLVEARRKLGKPMYPETLQEGENLYDIAVDACWLEVEIVKLKVRSMAIFCQP